MLRRIAILFCLPAMALAFGQTAAGQGAPCTTRVDPLAGRRVALAQSLPNVTDANLNARKQLAGTDPDSMVLVGDFYAAQHQDAQAEQWWNTAAQSGDPLGYEALGDHAANDLAARRRAYAQAAQLGDARAERVYGEMLMRGQGGPRLELIGREYLIQAAKDGSLSAMVLAGSAYAEVPGHQYLDVFSPIRDAQMGNCYLTAAAGQQSIGARRALRDAYEAGVLKDPVPVPSLDDASAFLTYLSSFVPERQPEVLSRAMAANPDSPNTLRALEERVWLSPPPSTAVMSPSLQVLEARAPQDPTALYFSINAELPTLPKNTRGQIALRNDAMIQLAQKLVTEGKAGQAALDNPGLTMGLDLIQLQPRLVLAKRAFDAAAALAPAVAEGQLWIHPTSPADVIADYLDARGGLDTLEAIHSADLVIAVRYHRHGQDPKTWQREFLAANSDDFPYTPPKDSSDSSDFQVPSFDSATSEFIVCNGDGWLMKFDNGPTQWSPDDPPQKRDRHIPIIFGSLNAPAAGDLDGPLVELGRMQQAHLAMPAISLVGRESLNGIAVIHLQVDGLPTDLPKAKDENSDKKKISDSDNPPPSFDAYLDASNYQLVRLSWSWQPNKDTETLDYSNYGRVAGIEVPEMVIFTSQQGQDDSNADVEHDQLVRLAFNPKVDPSLYSLTKDEAKKIKQFFEQKANSENNGGQ